MTFNSGKFEPMRYTQQTDPVLFESKTTDESNINRSTEKKDLIIHTSDQGIFLEQIMKSSLSMKKNKIN